MVDAGNNRILRFPKATTQSDPITPDLVLGQPNFNSRTLGLGDRSIHIFDGSTLYRSAIAFDSQGNLWTTDPGNNRVLRFPKSSLAGGGNAPADLVLGQPDLFTVASTQTFTALTKDRFSIPSALAFDANGNLFVSDTGRVLMYPPGTIANGAVGQQGSVRILGVIVNVSGQAPPTQAVIDNTKLVSPEGIFFLGNNVAIVDQYYSRILIFGPPSSWPPESTAAPSPRATSVVGQANFNTAQPPNGKPLNLGSSAFVNQGFAAPTGTALALPSQAVIANNELYIADTGNNRLLVLPVQGTSLGAATRLLGQIDATLNTANYIEGREFSFAVSGLGAASIVVDNSSGTPHLYVSDPFNNRILGFNDVRKLAPGTLLSGTYFQMGAKADLVIGQPDMFHSICNFNPQDPLNSDPSRPNQSSLCSPIGLALDPNGNLWVADNGNGRVLRFPQPFAALGTLPSADRVVGQSNFVSQILNTAQNTLRAPYGVAFNANGLLVSDGADNRVLFFPANNGDVPNGSSATKVFGQTRFTSPTSGNGPDQLNGPRHVAFDSDGRPYVADELNGRVVIYDQIANTPSTGAIGTTLTANMSRPRGIYVDQGTGEIQVADAGNGNIWRFTYFNNLPNENFQPDNNIPAGPQGYNLSPLAVAEDQFNDLIVADNSNRITFFYRSLLAVNGASYQITSQGNPLALTPGMLATICPPLRVGSSIRACQADDPHQFGEGSANATDLPNPIPWPTTLGDIQVLVNGSPAPISNVFPRQINFQMPYEAPSSGTIDLEVVQGSSGQVLGAGPVLMNVAAPAIFSQTGTGTGAGMINNQDGSLNTPANAASRGSVITMFLTGAGNLPNAPADGDVPQGEVDVDTSQLQVIIGAAVIDASTKGQDGNPALVFAGLTPGSVGIWQINVRIPDSVAPLATTPIGVRYRGVFNNGQDATRVLITAAVKQ